MRFPVRSALMLSSLACGAVAAWAAATQVKAKQCLDGELINNADCMSITERGCQMTTTSGAEVLIPITCPSFEVGVISALGFVVLGVAAAAVVISRYIRRSAH